MKPGARERPSASTIFAAVQRREGPTEAMRPFKIARSSNCASLPSPSSTLALRIRVSQFMRADSDYRLWIREARSGGESGVETCERANRTLEQRNRNIGAGLHGRGDRRPRVEPASRGSQP